MWWPARTQPNQPRGWCYVNLVSSARLTLARDQGDGWTVHHDGPGDGRALVTLIDWSPDGDPAGMRQEEAVAAFGRFVASLTDGS